MGISPYYVSIGRLFEQRYIFQVPKYQRSFAWEESQIDDFLTDIMKCFDARKNGSPFHHFFGGLVCILECVPGSGRQQQELIDGQQRISTFILLVATIIHTYKNLLNNAQVQNDPALEELIKSRIDRLQKQYMYYHDEINRKPVTIDRVTMSKVDRDFFKNLIEGNSSSPIRESHKRLRSALDKIEQAIASKIDSVQNLTDKVDILKIFDEIINEDCTVIHIQTDTKSEAYHLFQVLNDRGTKLTDGDLLRARTLEMLDHDDSILQQDFVEDCWDFILRGTPKQIDDFLRVYFSSHIGTRPGSYALFDDFMDKFFPHNGSGPATQGVDAIKERLASMKDEYEKYTQLSEGSWPYEISQPITQWDVERLYLLIKELDHSLCLPLLLAAIKLDHKKFSAIVQLAERFFFRYKHICNCHASPLGVVYLQEAMVIRRDPVNYNVSSLLSKLQHLQNSYADDDKFELLLKDLRYRSRSNKLLKYFLITLEYYLRWYRDGATGQPICQDKSRIYSFNSTTIEHVYPQNADGTLLDPSLESIKHDLGNLTILGPGDNNDLGNVVFSRKRTTFQVSSLLLNREMANISTWDVTSLQRRQEEIIKIAGRVFKI